MHLQVTLATEAMKASHIRACLDSTQTRLKSEAESTFWSPVQSMYREYFTVRIPPVRVEQVEWQMTAARLFQDVHLRCDMKEHSL